MNTDELAINWQNFARVRLQLKFAFIILYSIMKVRLQLKFAFIILLWISTYQ